MPVINLGPLVALLNQNCALITKEWPTLIGVPPLNRARNLARLGDSPGRRWKLEFATAISSGKSSYLASAGLVRQQQAAFCAMAGHIFGPTKWARLQIVRLFTVPIWRKQAYSPDSSG